MECSPVSCLRRPQPVSQRRPTGKKNIPFVALLSGCGSARVYIVAKGTHEDRDDRYQTAREMLTDLRRLKQRLDVGAEMERSIAPDGPGSPHITSGGGRGGSTMSGLPVGQYTTQLGAAPTISSAEYIAQGISKHKVGVLIATVLLVASVVGGAVLWSRFKPGDTARTSGKSVFSVNDT